MYSFASPVAQADFLAALTESHNVSCLGEVWQNGAPTGIILPILSGSVTVDLQNDWRRSCSVTVLDLTGQLTPPVGSANGYLTPYGSEIALYRTIRGNDSTGTPYPLVPLGVFYIASTKVVDAPEGQTIAIQGFDRAYRASTQQFTDTYTIAAGTLTIFAILDILTPRFPFTLHFNFPPLLATTPLLTYGVDSSVDPWKVCAQLAHDAGYQLFFDVSGTCVMQPWPEPTTQPTVWSMAEGQYSIMSQIERDLTNQSIPNHVIALGEGTGVTPPMRAEAAITDTNNPLHIYGPYGDVPVYTRTNTVTDQATLQFLADSTMLSYVGKQEQLTLQCIANPMLDVNDVVALSRGRSNVSGRYMIDTLTVPMEPETLQQVTFRLAVGAFAAS